MRVGELVSLNGCSWRACRPSFVTEGGAVNGWVHPPPGVLRWLTRAEVLRSKALGTLRNPSEIACRPGDSQTEPCPCLANHAKPGIGPGLSSSLRPIRRVSSPAMTDTHRLDAVNQSEVACVGLLLVVLLADPQRGVPAFLQLLEQRKVGARGFDHEPCDVPQAPPSDHWTPDTIDVGHELSVADDFVQAGLAIRPDCQGQDTPDLTLLLGYPTGAWVAVAIEAKFVYPWNLSLLNGQMALQRDNAIALLPRARPALDRYRHVALLPRELVAGEVLDGDGWITWADVAGVASEVLGEDHLVTLMLRAAVAHCAPAGPWRAIPTYEEIVAICRREGDNVEVGVISGRDWLRTASVDRLRGRRGQPWKVRPRSPMRLYAWVLGREFLELRGLLANDVP